MVPPFFIPTREKSGAYKCSWPLEFDRNQILLLATSPKALVYFWHGMGLLGLWMAGGPAPRSGATGRGGREAPLFTYL